MSHVEHQAVCITCWDNITINKINKIVSGLDVDVSEIHRDKINGYSTFFVFPCGSKAGWKHARDHLEQIELIKNAVNSFAYEDGSNSIDMHVAIYGEHEG